MAYSRSAANNPYESPHMVRKRSNTKLDSSLRGQGVNKYSRDAALEEDRLPTWQVAVLLAGSILLLYAAFSWSHPRLRAATAASKMHSPKCYELDDKDRVKLLGAQNKVVNHTIATSSGWAQVLFNLGLLAAHGFNQLEATSMFQACLRADPACAMCYWGLAYAQGPMPNKVPGRLGDPYPAFLPTHATDAYNYIQQALSLTHQAEARSKLRSAAERDRLYITAMAERFSKGAGALKGHRWREQEAKFAQQMQKIAEDAEDADAYALAAEAHMNLSPWDYYAADGSLKPNAQTAEQLLAKALHLQPHHTHALHLHIHVAEAGAPVSSPGLEHLSAARGLGSAEKLAALSSQNGHLMHMPSHIFLRTGRYKRAVEINKAAYDFDLSRGTHCIVPYLPEHNVHLLVYAASMAGMAHTAEAYAKGMRSLRSRMPDTWIAGGNEWVSLPLLHIRYGDWQSLLEMTAPPNDARGVTTLGGSQYASAVYHAGRALAMAARAHAAQQQVLGLEEVTAFDLAKKSLDLRHKEVLKVQQQMQISLSRMPTEPITQPGAGPGLYASGYHRLGKILSHLVEVRVQLLHDNTGGAIERLREAVELEDSLGYMEPPRVHQPVRQCLGWLLLQSGQLDEAWKVYSQDLQHHPNNGWSMLGLSQVAAARGQGVADATDKYRRAWRDAEVPIQSSCPALARPWLQEK